MDILSRAELGNAKLSVSRIDQVARNNRLYITPTASTQRIPTAGALSKIGIPELRNFAHLYRELGVPMQVHKRRARSPADIPHVMSTKAKPLAKASVIVNTSKINLHIEGNTKVYTHLPLAWLRLVSHCPPVVIEGLGDQLFTVGDLMPSIRLLCGYFNGVRTVSNYPATSWALPYDVTGDDGPSAIMQGLAGLKDVQGITISYGATFNSPRDMVKRVPDPYRSYSQSNRYALVVPTLLRIGQTDSYYYCLQVYSPLGVVARRSLAVYVDWPELGSFVSFSNVCKIFRDNEASFMFGDLGLNAELWSAYDDLTRLLKESPVTKLDQVLKDIAGTAVLPTALGPNEETGLSYDLPSVLGKALSRGMTVKRDEQNTATRAMSFRSTAKMHLDNARSKTKKIEELQSDILEETSSAHRLEHNADLLGLEIEKLKRDYSSIVKSFADLKVQDIVRGQETTSVLATNAIVSSREYMDVPISEYLKTCMSLSPSIGEFMMEVQQAGGGILVTDQCPATVRLLRSIKISTRGPVQIDDCTHSHDSIRGGPYEVTLIFTPSGKFIANLKVIRTSNLVIASEIQDGPHGSMVALKKHPHATLHQIPIGFVGGKRGATGDIKLEDKALESLKKWVSSTMDQADSVCLGSVENSITAAWLRNSEDEVRLNIWRWLISYNPEDSAGASYKMFPAISKDIQKLVRSQKSVAGTYSTAPLLTFK
jgi:hypothetical protein